MHDPMDITNKVYKSTSIQNEEHRRRTTEKDKYDDVYAESNIETHHNSSRKVTATSYNSSKYDDAEVKRQHYTSNSSNKHSYTSKQNEKDNSFRINFCSSTSVDGNIRQSNVKELNHWRSSSSLHIHRERSSNKHTEKSSTTSDTNKYSDGSDSNSKHSYRGRVPNSYNEERSAMQNDTKMNNELAITKRDSQHNQSSTSSKKHSEKSSSNKRINITNSDDHVSIFDNKQYTANLLRDDMYNINTSFNENNENDLQNGDPARHCKTSHRAESKHRINTTSENFKESNTIKKRSSDEKRSQSTKKVKFNGPVDEVNFTMGISFADALNMVTPTSSHKNKERDTIKSMYPANTTFTTKPVETIAENIKLEPLEINMQVDIPNIFNNYEPLPVNRRVMDCVYTQNKFKSNVTDEEAFRSGVSCKHMRTKVYSGVRNGNRAKIPSLLELSTRVLYKNIESIEYMGRVSFDILRPVLEKLNASQLSNLEHFNPYLLDDSDYLWKIHCGRKFRGRAPMEMESYRDMYMRCLEEDEIRLGQLTESIKQSQTVAIPIKQTKLAYMDTIVKPPRNVLKKQHQYGTERKLVATPAARVPTLAKITTNVRPGDVRLRVNGHERDTAQARSTVKRPKKAPLMLKTLQTLQTLQLMKGRHKR